MVRRLKAQAESARAVLIALTGYGLKYDREQSPVARFSYYFVKPVDTSKLLIVLEQINHRLGPFVANRAARSCVHLQAKATLATQASCAQLNIF